VALVGSTASVGAAQTFTDLAYNSPTNPSFPTQWNSHLCQWGGQAIGPNYAGSTWTGFAALDLRDYLFSGGQSTQGRCFVGGRSSATGFYQGVSSADVRDGSGWVIHQDKVFKVRAKCVVHERVNRIGSSAKPLDHTIAD
jgi:hypothetical protein